MTRLKVCGIRRIEDALLAAELGAHALGFVFWPSSPRAIDPQQARAIVEALPPFLTTVGVFVDQPVDEVASVARQVGLDAVQLHGHEAPEAYAGVTPRTIKSVAVTPDTDIVAALAAVPRRTMVLLDAHDPIKRGGTGRTIDWTLAAQAARIRPVMLSGGLTAGNIRTAIDRVRPYAVDVSSGVESSPGVKDATLLRAFFAAVAHHEVTT